ncbi:HEAT repeat domain-containing protein [Chondromyces crocatus]|uniref:Uncharacterized protein n=1 Tax=Chondromyces crocatus TaxID=52 RepID=A0A0K1EHL6_CHOCO|nr:HEAT repeat domain-containing protein [Chondromyces crocatus]AKT40371.1 uncharacterized protein CMC5_045240 [Chondromyces crocatus]
MAGLREDLQREIREGRVTCIVGAGVSMGAACDPESMGAAYDPDRKPNVASWVGLLESGVGWCAKLDKGFAKRAEIIRGEIASGHLDDLLSAAEKITRQLGGPGGGEFKRWLRETVGSLQIRDGRVPAALKALGVPLLTTNYDRILEEATGLPTLTWQDTAQVERVLRGEDQAIVHLHGYWDRPESVILGIRSYEDVLRDEYAQLVLHTLRLRQTLLFVGFGKGLDDPNFGALMRWSRKMFAGSEHRCYRLALDSEREQMQRQHPQDERVFVLSYGEEHEELGPFLEGLVDARPAASAGAVGAELVSMRELTVEERPRPRVLIAGPYFGLPAGLREEVKALWKAERGPNTAARIVQKLRRTDVEEAQIAAIVRHDVVVDASPWRAFARWWSLGFRNVEVEEPARAAQLLAQGDPLGWCAFPEGSWLDPEGAWEPVLSGRWQQLDGKVPGLEAKLREHVTTAGVQVCGFDDALGGAWSALVPQVEGAKVLSDQDLAGVPRGRLFRAEQALDGPLHEAGLSDYLRALRVVAGQVRLAGEEGERPIERVFVGMEVQQQVTPVRSTPDEDAAKLGAEEKGSADEAARPDQGEIDVELGAREAHRREVHASRREGVRSMEADRLAEVAPRVLLWGKAGTGKSTLLKWVACQSVGSARTPVWIDRLAPAAGALPEQLAREALRSVRLPESARVAQQQLREAIQGGKALLLLDGLDEAETPVQTTLPGRVAELGAGVQAVIASRPQVDTRWVLDGTGFVPVSLTGLQGASPRLFLERYFGVADWIAPLLRELHTLHAGAEWSRTPVLLSLVASLYQRDRALPHATLELYRDVVDELFGRKAQRWGLKPDSNYVAEARSKLAALARAMLLPTHGEPRIAARRDEAGEFLAASGLFTGAEWLRFAHLSLGEYLAAQPPLDLGEALAWFRRTTRISLDVVPMAVALQGRAGLELALRAAEEDDTWDHRMLGLVLRALALGGEQGATYDRALAQRVVKAVVERLMSPSGRFGEAERQLAVHAERGLRVLGTVLAPEDRALVTPLLEAKGALGTEALLMVWAATLEEIRRPLSDREQVGRVGSALAARGPTPADLSALTRGEARNVRAAAVAALATDSEARPLLTDALRDEHWDVRAAAVTALANHPEARLLLTDALCDRVGYVRAAAVTALANHPEARLLLTDALRDENRYVRAAAVTALANHPEARLLLTDALRDEDSYVRAAAVTALANHPEARLLLTDALRDEHWDVRAAAVTALANHPEARLLLTDALRDEDRYVRAAAVTALANHPEARLLLTDALRDEDRYVRAAAVTALANHPEARLLLTDALRDENRYVRAAAVTALANHPEARLLLTDALRDEHWDVRAAAVTALANHPEARLLLTDALRDENSDVRAAAVTALANHPEARLLLTDALRDENSDVRAAAVTALANYPEARLLLADALRIDFPNVRAAAVTALANHPEVRLLLTDALRDENSDVRAAAVTALADHPEARLLLTDALRDEKSYVRATAVTALANHPEARLLLTDALRDENSDVRAAAVTALANYPEARLLLTDALRDENSDVRAAAVTALANYPEARLLLTDALRDENSDVRAAAVTALANYPEARLLLTDALRDENSDVRATAVTALANHPEARLLLTDALRDEDRYVRAAAVTALADHPEARLLLTDTLRDEHWDVRAAAVTALANHPEARLLLTDALRDEDWDVRAAAVTALANHPEARLLLTDALRDEDRDVRAAAVRALANHPEARRLLTDALRDEDRYVRAVAVATLRPRSPSPSAVLSQLPVVQPALRLAGHASAPSLALPADALQKQDRLARFLQSPGPIHLETDLPFAEALLGALCVRLTQTTGSTFRLFGEFSAPPSTLVGLPDAQVVHIIRIAMDADNLVRDRSVLPTHNLIEAWRIARHLQTERSITFWLVCADLDFEDIVPPVLETPGTLYMRPPFFGFRLPSYTGSTLDPPLEVLTSLQAERAWTRIAAPDQAALLQTIEAMLRDPDTDIWTLLPMLGRIGHHLPPDLRRAVAERLPQDLEQAATHLERARSALDASPSDPALGSTDN